MTKEERSGETDANRRLDNEIADEFITFANNKQTAGVHPTIIASAIRHAAANYTAFACVHGTGDALATESITEEFLRMLEFYENHHRG